MNAAPVIYQLRGQLSNQIRTQVAAQVIDQIRNQVWVQVWDQVSTPVWSQTSLLRFEVQHNLSKYCKKRKK